MAFKTISDCTHCPKLAECDAHISLGSHRHNEGPHPCNLVFSTAINEFEII